MRESSISMPLSSTDAAGCESSSSDSIGIAFGPNSGHPNIQLDSIGSNSVTDLLFVRRANAFKLPSR